MYIMKTTIILNSKTLGRGNDELGEKMMGNFLRKLWGLDKKPDIIIFYNSAVQLLVKGSPVLDAIDALGKAGVDLIACVTCVDFYKLEGKLAAGRVSDMQEIASTLMKSDKVITP